MIEKVQQGDAETRSLELVLPYACRSAVVTTQGFRPR